MDAQENSIDSGINIGVIFWPALVVVYGLLIAMGIWFIWG